MSEQNICKGERWFQTLIEALNDARACVICLTRDNVLAPWIHFESGVIAGLRSARIWPFLVGLRPSDVEKTPLAGFQCTVSEKSDVRRLALSVNSALGRGTHHKKLIDNSFEMHWPELEQRLAEILGANKRHYQAKHSDANGVQSCGVNENSSQAGTPQAGAVGKGTGSIVVSVTFSQETCVNMVCSHLTD
ncbi:MAG TPA: hypothetical protein VMW24_18880 [Sedimentisphaerales bacterium]|nr:hypothetical protein [Sedimentisphaerales bacterium]